MYTGSKVIVRYAETDKMGIVHHSVYPIWYELSRTEFIKEYGLTYTEMERQGIMLPLVEMSARFIMPADYEDELIVKTKIEKLTPVRIVFGYEVYKKGEVINTGSTMHAITNVELRPINLKKVNPKLYYKLEAML